MTQVSQIFKKHFFIFLTIRYEYMQMSELMMSSPHNFPFILYVQKNEKNVHISAMRMLDLALIPL